MPPPPDVPSAARLFAAGLKVQARCLYALMVREMMMRFGRDNLGFLWVIVEPMLLCVGVMLLWSFLHAPFQHGISIVELVLTGYMPLTLWRHLTISAGVMPFRRSANLLYHRHVSMLDVFLTRAFLEFVGATTAFVLVATILTAAGLIEPPHDLGPIMLGWIAMALLSSGVALITALISETSEVAEKFVPVFQYLMLPISGVFFMVDWLPSYAQRLVWYNPTVHCFEMIRAGFMGDAVRTFYAAWYPIGWGLFLFALGIGFVEKMRDRVHA